VRGCGFDPQHLHELVSFIKKIIIMGSAKLLSGGLRTKLRALQAKPQPGSFNTALAEPPPSSQRA
jgi:hypothetical protein